jgi:hypothetical protein
MCLVIAVISAIFAFNLLSAGHHGAAFAAGAVALLFTVLMVRNILRTKKERNEKP